ncbi:MAG TPA: hypothetical protein VKS60_19525 [Stellaceae bacterium]|nr:hypothetical protein [Stellaceae bacterium]
MADLDSRPVAGIAWDAWRRLRRPGQRAAQRIYARLMLTGRWDPGFASSLLAACMCVERYEREKRRLAAAVRSGVPTRAARRRYRGWCKEAREWLVQMLAVLDRGNLFEVSPDGGDVEIDRLIAP